MWNGTDKSYQICAVAPSLATLPASGPTTSDRGKCVNNNSPVVPKDIKRHAYTTIALCSVFFGRRRRWPSTKFGSSSICVVWRRWRYWMGCQWRAGVKKGSFSVDKFYCCLSFLRQKSFRIWPWISMAYKKIRGQGRILFWRKHIN